MSSREELVRRTMRLRRIVVRILGPGGGPLAVLRRRTNEADLLVGTSGQPNELLTTGAEGTQLELDALAIRLDDLAARLEELKLAVRNCDQMVADRDELAAALDRRVEGLAERVDGLVQSVLTLEDRTHRLTRDLNRTSGVLQDQHAIQRRLGSIEDSLSADDV